MKNPIRAIRMELELSQGELAIIAREWGSTISLVERGERKPTKRLLKTLAELGFDISKVQQEYAEFTKWKRQRLLEELEEYAPKIPLRT